MFSTDLAAVEDELRLARELLRGRGLAGGRGSRQERAAKVGVRRRVADVDRLVDELRSTEQREPGPVLAERGDRGGRDPAGAARDDEDGAAAGRARSLPAGVGMRRGRCRRRARAPSAPRATSTSRPPRRSSATTRSATTSGDTSELATSIAFTAASGHSAAAVLTSPGRPPLQARSPARPDAAKSPPVSCRVTSRRSPGRSPRDGPSRLRAPRAEPRSPRPASPRASRPLAKMTADASPDTCATARASTPRPTSRAAIRAPIPRSSSTTSTRPPPRRPGSAKPRRRRELEHRRVARDARRRRRVLRGVEIQPRRAGAHPGGGVIRRRYSFFFARPSLSENFSMNPTTSRSVLRLATSSRFTSLMSGIWPSNADRISTRLIESMPRSASSC